MPRSLTALAAAAAFLCAGCLRQETTHIIYLSPDGRASWTTLERDVRSDEKDPSSRAREEREWLAHIGAGVHPVAVALEHLGASSLRTRLLRGERPYTVLTEARFETVDQAIDRLLRELQVPATVRLTASGGLTTLAAVIQWPADGSAGDLEGPLLALVDPEASYRVALTSGRFLSATGFRLDDDRTVAVLDGTRWDRLECPCELTFALTWSH